MIRTIAQREFLEYFTSVRFMIGFLVTLALMTLSTVINAGEYFQRAAECEEARVELGRDKVQLKLFRTPEPLGILTVGIEQSVGPQAEMTDWSLPVTTTGYMASWASLHRRFSSGFPSIDFAFVVRIAMSLLVIFLAFSAVAGEKADGTLRLTLSNPVPRTTMLAGKAVGGFLFVLVMLAAAMIVSLLVIVLHPSIVLGAEGWMRILGMFGISALYLALFFFMALCASVLFSRPSTALLFLLQAWILLVVVWPTIAVIAAARLSPLPSGDELAERLNAALAPLYAEGREINTGYEQAWGRGEEPPRELRLRFFENCLSQAAARERVDLELVTAQERQRRLAELLSTGSPAALYDQAVQRIARTGYDQYNRFLESVHRYWGEFTAFSRIRTVDRDEAKTRDLPGFTQENEPLSETIPGIASHAAILLCLSFIFFGCAYAGMLRKDVR